MQKRNSIQIQLLFLLIRTNRGIQEGKLNSNTTIVSINLDKEYRERRKNKFKYNYCFY